MPPSLRTRPSAAKRAKVTDIEGDEVPSGGVGEGVEDLATRHVLPITVPFRGNSLGDLSQTMGCLLVSGTCGSAPEPRQFCLSSCRVVSAMSKVTCSSATRALGLCHAPSLDPPR